jgi:hypothetical protein
MYAKFERSERLFIRCEDCHDRAVISLNNGIDKKTGKMERIGVCLEHHELRHLNTALKWNHKMGLDTVEKRMKYVFETPFKFKEL